MALTLAAARHEVKTRRQPHTILPVYRHAEGCLVSDGTIIPVYPCTCKRPVHVGYTLRLGGK